MNETYSNKSLRFASVDASGDFAGATFENAASTGEICRLESGLMTSIGVAIGWLTGINATYHTRPLQPPTGSTVTDFAKFHVSAGIR